MGTYYGVTAILKKGKLMSFSATRTQPPISSMQVLVGILDSGLYAIAVDLTKKSEYDYFYELVLKGVYCNMELYTVYTWDIKHCPNMGKVRLEEIEDLRAQNHKKLIEENKRIGELLWNAYSANKKKEDE